MRNDSRTNSIRQGNRARTWEVLDPVRGEVNLPCPIVDDPAADRILASGSVDSTIVLWNLAPRIVPPTASADFDGSGAVDFADFVQFAANFGSNQGDTGFDAQFDLDMDGTIGFGDFLIFVKAFGE